MLHDETCLITQKQRFSGFNHQYVFLEVQQLHCVNHCVSMITAKMIKHRSFYTNIAFPPANIGRVQPILAVNKGDITSAFANKSEVS